MKVLLVSANKTIKELLNKHDVVISSKYDETISLLKEDYDAIIIDGFLEINILKILNSYKDDDNYRKTIIIDNIRLYSYSMIKTNKQVFAILNNLNLNQNLDYYLEELNTTNNIYNKNKSDLYNDIAIILKRLGISPDKEGFHYLRKAIYECYLRPNILKDMKNKLYPILIDTFKTNRIDIERSMRYSIEIGFRKSEYEYADKLFSNTLDIEQIKPRCSELIAIVVDELMHMNNKTFY